MKKFKKSLFTLFTAIYIVMDIFGVLIFVGSAKAQMSVADPVVGFNTGLKNINDIKKESQLSVTKILTMSAMGALINSMSFFTRKIAYDTAKYIASGGRGQDALIFKDGIGKYAENVAKDTLGEAIGSIGEPFGLNLCKIPNPRLDIFLKIGFGNLFGTGGPRSKCSWQELEWTRVGETLEKRYGPGGSRFMSETFNAKISVSDSDFGIALGAMAQLDQIRAAATAAANLERTFSQGVKDLTSPISGRTMTPALSIQQEIEGLSARDQKDLTAGQIAGVYASELESLPAMAANVFLNSLVSNLLKNIMTGLFSDDPGSQGGLSAGVGSYYASTLQSNRKSAERAFSFLTAPTIIQVDNYKIVDKLVAERVIDSGLQQAISRGNTFDTAITVAEALRLNFLHADWVLIPPTNVLNSDVDNDCYVKAYCYSNLQKIRKARILSSGFELAALKSDPDSPWVLGRVVDGFSDCNQFGEADPTHPYCHLIDPNWVIKSPPARCQTDGVGPDLVTAGSNVRKNECMDLQTCISQNDDGTCNAWGYCTKEENVWRLGGDSCPSYYNTCTTFQNKSTNSQASYLSRTLDFGQCTSESIGCQAYSSEQENGNWKTVLAMDGSFKGLGRNEVLYFNKNVETCPAGAEGCTAFYGAQRNVDTGVFNQVNDKYIRDSANMVHLKKAPDYLGCYDINVSTLNVEWPQSKAEALIKLASNNSRCNDFAQVCAPAEAGCEEFIPADGTGSITGIIDANNTCAKECVGYETFRQEKSNFEGGKFPLYFVPDSGTTCSAQAVGCDEFTNLGSVAAGGESLAYYNYTRLCEAPDSIDEAAFFSWEGSETEGFVLRNHLLKTISTSENSYISGLNLTYTAPDDLNAVFPVGSPSYGDNIEVSLQTNYDTCNAVNYAALLNNPFVAGAANADCRQLYDNAGHIYYRIVKNTVIIDSKCQRLRKTNAYTFIDANITTSVECLAQYGFWDGADCRRCYGGGVFGENSCIYSALPSESSSCAAAENGCRAYTGNAGNNISPEIIYDTFEVTPPTTANWNAGAGAVLSISAEALQTTQHSLGIRKNAGTVFVERVIPIGAVNATASLNKDAWYELSFWARGANENVTINFDQNGTDFGLFTYLSNSITSPSSISIGDDWQEYRLGPTQFTGDSLQTVNIEFRIVGSGANSVIFIDNLKLTQIQDSIYLLKDSWKQFVDYNGEQVVANAPVSCYGGIDPRGEFPGMALGCREYTDNNNNTYYITGFSALCRESAVGCQPVYDSNNTVGEILPKLYNAVCAGSVGPCEINLFGSVLGSCNIPQGQTKCYVEEIKLPINDNNTPSDTSDDFYRTLADVPGSNYDISTIYIPPESADPVYLTNRKEYQCGESMVGCTLLGKQEKIVPSDDTASYSYSDVYILNNPIAYNKILCREDLIGCYDYAVGANTYYFKDPAKTGNAICEYKDNVDGFTGWFKKDVGKCVNGNNVESDILCRATADCPTAVPATAENTYTCQKIGSIPCYEDYLLNGNYYDIWSNKSANYEGLVGACEPRYNLCAELVDPQDTSSINPEGRPYYRIFDNRLTGRISECEGKVSLKEGCVLFDKTDQPNKLYSTVETYRASDVTIPQYGLVNPISSTAANTPNNANIILKVSRDRECSEWLSCKSAVISYDKSGKKQVLCSRYQACNQLKENQAGLAGGCANPVDMSYGNTFLDEEKYASRDISWYGFDYSGYSILNKHQISTYGYFTFPGFESYQFLAADIPVPSYGTNTCVTSSSDNTDGVVCGPSGQGVCYNGRCLYKIDNTQFTAFSATATREEKLTSIKNDLLPTDCKVYPETTSPFPRSLAAGVSSDQYDEDFEKSHLKTNNGQIDDKSRIDFMIPNSDFSNVDICQSSNEDCSCNYVKYKYGAGGPTDYYALSDTGFAATAPKGVCVGGDRDGQPCEFDDQCKFCQDTVDNVCPNPLGSVKLISSGSCASLKEKETKFGMLGFCLEPDLSHPINGLAILGKKQEYACQTWLPIQTSASNIDLYNLYANAGYSPSLDGASGVPSGELYCASTYGSNIVDGRMGVTQADIDNNAYGETTLDGRFNNNFAASFCANGNEFISAGLFANLYNANGTSFESCPEFANPICTTIPSRPNINYYLCGITESLDDAKDNVYRDLMAFLWNRVGRNSLLLRFESVLNLSGFNDSNYSFAPWRVPNNGLPQIENDSWYETTAHRTDETDVGLYNFSDAPALINEYNIKNLYFIPLGYKGTIKGVVPRTITQLALSDLNANEDALLKLPIEELRNGTFPNGQIITMDGFYIDKNRDTNINTIVNFSTDKITVFTAPFSTRKHNGSGSSDNQGRSPLVLWRYVVKRADKPNLFSADDISNNVQTKYVLVWAANDTGVVFDNGGACNNDIGCGTTFDNDGNASSLFETGHGTDFDAPNFLSGTEGSGIGGTFARLEDIRNEIGVFVPTDDQNSPFDNDNFCQRGFNPDNVKSDGRDGENQPHFNPWWAVAVNFDENGGFVGYTTRWCRGYRPVSGNVNGYDYNNENAALGAGISYAVVADIDLQCHDFVQVYEDAVGTVATTNKAWTHMVWRGAVNGNGGVLEHPWINYGIDGNRRPVIKSDFSQRPFGSVGISVNEMGNANSALLAQHVFKGRAEDGVPYSCNTLITRLVNGASVFFGGRTCIFPTVSKTNDNYSAYTPEIRSNLATFSDITATGGISRLFSKYFATAVRGGDGVNFMFPMTFFNDNSADYNGKIVMRNTPYEQFEFLLPPRVFSLNPMFCVGENFGQGCTAGDADNMTVNDINGTRRSVDYNDDGFYELAETEQSRDIIARSALTANVKFFAYADDNRMPIRKITVNWGDGDTQITNVAKQGYYKNSKPFCQDQVQSGGWNSLCEMYDPLGVFNEKIPSGLTCNKDSDCPIGLLAPQESNNNQSCLTPNELKNLAIYNYGGPRFGNSARACTSVPMEFEHTYNFAGCTTKTVALAVVEDGLASETVTRLSEEFNVGQGGLICIFKPRVQVIDNWGYCNGKCVGGLGGDYCYSGEQGEDVFNNNAPGSGVGECEWPDAAGMSNKDQSPYTEYQGNIIIIPAS